MLHHSKRFRLFSLALFVMFFSLVQAACRNASLKDERSSQKERVAVFDTKETFDRDQLVFLSLSNDYKLTEEDVYYDLQSFLLAKDGGLLEDDSETLDTSICRDITESKYDVNKSASFSKPFKTIRSQQRKTRVIDDGSDIVNFSIFNIKNKDDGSSGFAVMSDDERVGSVLCVIEDSEYNETVENPLLTMFMDNIDAYVEEVVNEWDSITEDDYEQFKEKYGITDEDIQKAKEDYENEHLSRKFWGYGNWSNWQIVDINLNNLISKTKWDQGYFSYYSPYNDAIKAVCGRKYVAGCGAIAVAQIMAYHRYPTTYHSDLAFLKSKWDLACSLDWNGVYDWDAMTLYPDANYLSQAGKVGVGALIYEVFNGCKSQPVEYEGTSTYMSDRIDYLRSIGYSCDNAKGYSYSRISDSLHNNCPVMVRGSDDEGHAWVIDGSVELKRSRKYYVFWIPFPDNEYQSYVHCNYGWGGTDDDGNAYSYAGTGYYKSGVFSTSNGNFSNSLQVVTNIRPR